MNESNIFYINKAGVKITATILTNFELYGEHYCIYTTESENKEMTNIYCAKIRNNELVKIEDEEEIKLTDKIVKELMSQN